NGEQDPFIESTQTPFLKGCLRREAQRRGQAGQQERDWSEQSEDPSRAVYPFRILPAQNLVVAKPLVLQTSQFFEERLDEFGKFQLGGALRLKLDCAECISDHIIGHGRGPLLIATTC